jgi:hypothetical protein
MREPDGRAKRRRTSTRSMQRSVLNAAESARDARSPAEVLLETVADVNRSFPELPNERSLSTQEDRKVFSDVKLFLADDTPGSRSLERLYQVIQNREIR